MNGIFKKPFYIKYLIAFSISVLYFLFNLHYMQQFLDWDQVWYLDHIQHGLRLGKVMWFVPPHLHLEFISVQFHNFIVNTFGQYGFTDVFFNTRLYSLLTSCVGIFFAILFLNNITGKLVWGVLGGLLIAFCHGYLSYSTQADTGIFPAAGMLITLWCINKIENSNRFLIPLFIVTGIVLFIDVMFHQYMALACVTIFISLLLPPYFFKVILSSGPFCTVKKKDLPLFDRNPKLRFLGILLMTIVAALLISTAYFYVGKSLYNLPYDRPNTKVTVGPYWEYSFQSYIFCYEVSKFDWWGRGFSDYNPKDSFRGATNAFLSPTGYKYIRFWSRKFKYNLKQPFADNSITHNQVALLCFIATLGTIVLFPLIWKQYKRTLVFIVSSLVLFSVFISYWEPAYFEFWLVPCTLVCILGILVLNWAGGKLSLVVKKVGHWPFYAITMALIFSLFAHNLLYYLIPYSRTKHTEDMNPDWSTDHYMNKFSTYIYRYPDDPYKTIYKMKPIR